MFSAEDVVAWFSRGRERRGWGIFGERSKTLNNLLFMKLTMKLCHPNNPKRLTPGFSSDFGELFVFQCCFQQFSITNLCCPTSCLFLDFLSFCLFVIFRIAQNCFSEQFCLFTVDYYNKNETCTCISMPVLTDIFCHNQKVNLIGKPVAHINTIILILLHLRDNILIHLSRCVHVYLQQPKLRFTCVYLHQILLSFCNSSVVLISKCTHPQ